MPKKSPHVLSLTADQRRELEARSRCYTLPYRGVVRAEIMLVAARGPDNDEIAARLDTGGRSCPSGESASARPASPAWRRVPWADGHAVRGKFTDATWPRRALRIGGDHERPALGARRGRGRLERRLPVRRAAPAAGSVAEPWLGELLGGRPSSRRQVVARRHFRRLHHARTHGPRSRGCWVRWLRPGGFDRMRELGTRCVGRHAPPHVLRAKDGSS